MDMIGSVDIDELDALKKELRKTESDFNHRVLNMIGNMEHTITTMFMNHQNYVHWAVAEMKNRHEKSNNADWEDRMGGQFTQEEIERSRNGGW